MQLYRKTYLELVNITKATCCVKASDVGYGELAWVAGRLAQVIKIKRSEITLQVFAGTQGLSNKAEVLFTGKQPHLIVNDSMAGRSFNAYGNPIDNLLPLVGSERNLETPAVNPVKRLQPHKLIATGLAGIDLNNTIVAGQKIPFFADPDQPYNEVIAMVALRAKVDKIILGGMGLSNDDYLFYKQSFQNAGVNSKIISFINKTDDPPVERLLIPSMALCTAEYFAFEKNEQVLVLLTDMTLYCDALSIVANRMDQIPSKDSMPGSLYSDLAKIYEKAVQLPSGGSITIISVTSLNDGDITHAIPDNTGYITEGQLFLRRSGDISKVIIDPFRSLSRLKQLVIGKTTRADHPHVMNSTIRLFSDASNSVIKRDNGFELTDYDKRTIEFAKDYSREILAIDTNLEIEQMLDICWKLLKKYFTADEIQIKQEYVDLYFK